MDTPSGQEPQPLPQKEKTEPLTQKPVETPPSISNYPHHSFSSRRPVVMYALIALILVGGMALGLVSLTSTSQSRDVRSRATNNGPILSLSPATKTGGVGTTFSLGMTINTNDDTVSAAELHLSYDKTAIEIMSFTPGTPLPVVLAPETHANGTISVVLGAQNTSPFKGAGIIGTWLVKILSGKQSTMTITSATQVAALGKTTNVLASATGATITGTGTGTVSTSTPTPTHAPGITTTPTPISTVGRQNTNPPSTNTIAPSSVPDTQMDTPVVATSPTQNSNTANEWSPFAGTTSQATPPKTNVFQQVLTGILQFFQGLFKK